jgi:hypothetical protein
MKHNVVIVALGLTILMLAAGCGSAATPVPPTATATMPPTSTPEPTDTPIPTATQRPTATLRPTATKPPTSTPQPTVDAPSGFKPIEGDGITLWLPESFEGGSMTGKDREVLLKGMAGLGGDFARMAEQFEAAADNMLFLAFNSEVNEQGGVNTVNVIEIPALSGMKPVTLASMLVEQLPNQIKGIKLSEVEAVELPQYPAARFTAQMNINNFMIKEAIYVVKAGDAIYLVTFAALDNEFEEWLPVFEQSIQTFTAEP